MRVLIIGLGSVAKKHIAALKEVHLGVEFFALRSSAAAPAVNGVHDISENDDIRLLQLDFIIICNPTFKHRDTIANVLPLNLPLFIEKPLFDKLEGESLLNVIHSQKTATYVACNLRFLECLRFAKEAIKNKRINEVNVYCGSYLPDWRPGKDFRAVYSANREMGGGVHIDLIHELDYTYWIFGRPKHVRRTTTSLSSLKITAFDYANYLLQFEQYNINIVLNYFRRDARRTLEVVCEEGTLNVNLLKNEVYWNGDLLFKSKQQVSDTYAAQMRFFIEEVLIRKQAFNTVAEAYEILKICLEAE